MPSNRTPISRPPRPRISPEMLAAYQRALEILEAGGDEDWEEEGGNRREYLNLSMLLHRALGRKPWMYDVLDIDLGDPDVDEDPGDLGDWRGAVGAARALEAARKRGRAAAANNGRSLR
jgi:hypothetical protein